MGQRGRPRHPDLLTPREQAVLALIRDGLTNEQIAERLGIGFETAKSHVAEILSKLGVSTREEAAAWRPSRKRAFSHVFRWLLAGGAGAAIVGLALLAWGVWRSGDTDAPGPFWPNCKPTDTHGYPVGIHVLNGATCEVTTIAGSESVDASPVWSPDNRYLAYLGVPPGGEPGDKEIFVADADTGEVRQISDLPNRPKNQMAWAPNGGLVFSSTDPAQPGYQWDSTILEYDTRLPGQVPRVIAHSLYCINGMAVSSLGKISVAYGCGPWQLALIDIDSGAISKVSDGEAYGMSWSPNGESLLYQCPHMTPAELGSNCIKRGDEAPRQLTSDAFKELGWDPLYGSAAWTQDGSIVLFGENSRLLVLAANGSTGVRYDLPSGLTLQNVDWGNGKVISSGRCQYPPEPTDSAVIGACPDEQTLSLKLATGEEKVVVDADCFTLTTWSPNGSRLAIIVPVTKACGV